MSAFNGYKDLIIERVGEYYRFIPLSPKAYAWLRDLFPWIDRNVIGVDNKTLGIVVEDALANHLTTLIR